jgi:four helix bundle protein
MNKAHKNLQLWKESFDMVKVINTSTMTFPQEEKFGLISQIRKAVVSIPVNIAEGAARISKREFLNFMSIARGLVAELDTLYPFQKTLISSSQMSVIL